MGYKASCVNRFSAEEIEELKTSRRTSTFEAIHDLPSPFPVLADDRGISWTKDLLVAGAQ